MDVGLMVGFAGVLLAALAGMLGVWMERDRSRPPYFAILFSLLIVFASFIELGRTVVSAWNDAAAADAMAEVLEQLTEISERSDNPELASFVGAELSRANPKTLKRVQKKVAAKGGDPDAVKRRAAEAKGGGGGARTGKAGKAEGGGAVEGKAGKGEGGEGKAGKADGESKAGKADGASDEGKAGKAAPGAEGKTGKSTGDDSKTGKGGKAD